MSRFFLLILTCASIGSLTAHAFPEMVRHGYANCTACHASPDGGGILNAYGRGSSLAVLSASGDEREVLPFYGAVNLPESIQIQSFIRAVQTYEDTPQARSGDSQFMQADIEASTTLDRFTLVASGGIEPNYLSGKAAGRSNDSNKLLSREHYLIYHASDEASLRLGKFMMDYGIHIPDHTSSTREGLDWGPYSESYNLEASYGGERFSTAVTAVFGRPERPNLKSESGIALTGAIHLLEKHKIGLSFFQGYSAGSSRQVAGPYGIFGFTNRVYLLAEADWQFRHGGSATSRGPAGFVSYNRFGYELFQGFHIYAMHQNQFSRLGDSSSLNHSYGPGILFYPRPHFEFQAQLARDYNALLDQNETSGFLMGSFSL